MRYWEWSTEYETGFSEIDEQHQQLIKIGKKLQEAASTEQAQTIVDEILRDMFYYASDHFLFEIHMLKSLGYEDLEEHIRQHEDFFTQLEDHARKLEGSRTLASIEILATLQTWLITHIVNSDKKAFDEISARRLKAG